MAKAVMPIKAFRDKFGDLGGQSLTGRLHELVAEFLHENAPKDGKSVREDGHSEAKVEHEPIKAR
jgi:hypothetical protein